MGLIAEPARIRKSYSKRRRRRVLKKPKTNWEMTRRRILRSLNRNITILRIKKMST